MREYIAVRPYGETLIYLKWRFKDKTEMYCATGVPPPEGCGVFDEQELGPPGRTDLYASFCFDEIYHVRTAYEIFIRSRPYEITHPPLGKIILACGIEMFRTNPFGWRFIRTLTGVLMLPLMYIFAKMLLKKTKYAAFTTILLQRTLCTLRKTRISTIDSYSILWIMLMYLFMYLFYTK